MNKQGEGPDCQSHHAAGGICIHWLRGRWSEPWTSRAVAAQRSAGMQIEESLDHLIDQPISGENHLSPTENEIAALLAAAKRLIQLQEIAIPFEFAHHLEVSLRARIHTIRRQYILESLGGRVVMDLKTTRSNCSDAPRADRASHLCMDNPLFFWRSTSSSLELQPLT